MNDETNPNEEQPDDFMFVWACGFELAIGVVGLTLGWILGVDARAYIGHLKDLTWQSVGMDLGMGAIASIPMTVAVALLMRIPHESITAIKRLSDAPTMKALLSMTRIELLTLSVCAGIGEELAFRGFLLPWITAIGDSSSSFVNPFTVGDSFRTAAPVMLTAAILFSSIGFGLLHPITKLYVVVAALMGVYFGALLVVTDSLVVPIVAHATYDASQFLIAKREIQDE